MFLAAMRGMHCNVGQDARQWHTWTESMSGVHQVRRMEHPSGACGVCGKPALYEYVPKERLGGAEARQGNVNVPIE